MSLPEKDFSESTCKVTGSKDHPVNTNASLPKKGIFRYATITFPSLSHALNVPIILPTVAPVEYHMFDINLDILR